MNEYKVHTLRDGLYSIEDRHVRFFLLEGDSKALLVDTGFGSGDLKTLVGGLTDKPVTLIITHADGDHIGATRSSISPCCIRTMSRYTKSVQVAPIFPSRSFVKGKPLIWAVCAWK